MCVWAEPEDEEACCVSKAAWLEALDAPDVSEEPADAELLAVSSLLAAEAVLSAAPSIAPENTNMYTPHATVTSTAAAIAT